MQLAPRAHIQQFKLRQALFIAETSRNIQVNFSFILSFPYFFIFLVEWVNQANSGQSGQFQLERFDFYHITTTSPPPPPLSPGDLIVELIVFLSQLLHLLDLVFHLGLEFQSDWSNRCPRLLGCHLMYRKIKSIIMFHWLWNIDDDDDDDGDADDEDYNDDDDDDDGDDNDDDDGHQPLYLVPVESEGVHRVQIDWSIILSHQ